VADQLPHIVARLLERRSITTCQTLTKAMLEVQEVAQAATSSTAWQGVATGSSEEEAAILAAEVDQAARLTSSTNL